MIRSSPIWATVSKLRSAGTQRRRFLARILLGCLLAGAPAQGAAQPLAGLLDHVGNQVEKFWSYLQGVTCIEQLTQTKLDGKGKTLFDQRATYDYLVLLQSSGDQISVEESRVEKTRKDQKGKAALLTTSGFSILALIFHPLYQSSFEFEQLPDDVVAGRPVRRVAFRQLQAERSPSVLNLRDREFPLQWKGTAWIDPSSYAVIRIEAALAGSMEDIGLLQLRADVTYDAVHFSGNNSEFWLPSRAAIEAVTRRQRWRNTHVFADYRRFDVDTVVRTADLK